MSERISADDYNWKGGATHGVIAPIMGFGFSKVAERFTHPDPTRDLIIMMTMTFGFGVAYAAISEFKTFIRNIGSNGFKR